MVIYKLYIFACSGKGFCMDLANKGMNIVLVSRSKIKLDEVSSQIRKKYKVDTKIIVIDFIKEKKTIKLIQNAIQVILFFPN